MAEHGSVNEGPRVFPIYTDATRASAASRASRDFKYGTAISGYDEDSFDIPNSHDEVIEVHEPAEHKSAARKRTNSGAYKGPEATLKKNRVVIGAILISGVLLMALVTFLPFWISVKKEGVPGIDGEIYFMFGPYSMQFRGIVHTTSSMLAQCEASNPPISVEGCNVIRDIDYIAAVVLGTYMAILLGICYGTLHLLVGRVRMALVYWFACVISTVSVTQIFFTVGASVAKRHGFTSTTGTCSTLFVIVALLVMVDVIFVTVLWLMARDEWSTMGVDADYVRRNGMAGTKALHKLKKANGKFRKRYDQVHAPDYDRDVHMCGLGHCYVLTETGLLKKKGWFWGSLHWLALVPIHFVKTFDWGPIRMSWFGPASEMESVRKHGKVSSTIVINYMLYRRSNMICIVGFGIPLFLYKLGHLNSRWSENQESAKFSTRVSFKDWSAARQDPAWKDFTSHVAEQILRSLGANFNAVEVYKFMIYLLLLGFSIVCAAIATKHWHDFRFTRAMLNMGFMASISATTIQAFSSFAGHHDFSNVNVLANGYMDDIKEYFNAKEWMNQCVELNLPLLVASASVSLRTYCPKIPRGSSGVWDMRSDKVGTFFGQSVRGVYDFRQYAEYCDMARNVTERRKTEELAQFTHAACKMLDELIYDTGTDRSLRSDDESELRYAVEDSVFPSAEQSAERVEEIERLAAEAHRLENQLAHVRARSEFLKRTSLKSLPQVFAAKVDSTPEECDRMTHVQCGKKNFGSGWTNWVKLGSGDCTLLNAVCDKPEGEGFCQCNPGTCWQGGLGSSTCKSLLEKKQENDEARQNATALLSRYKDKYDFNPETVRERVVKATVQLENIVGTVEDAIDGISSLVALMFLINGLGPGLVISAMTAKLIFVNSSLAGKFIIAFPICYCPPMFAFWGLLWVVVRDAEFAIVMLIWSFWPILLSMTAKWTGFHLPMSDERAMFMANYMLVAFYFWIILSYIVICRYSLVWSPTTALNWWEPEVWVKNQPRELVFGYISSLFRDGKWFYNNCDSFVSYFLTCCAVGDFFIAMTVQEHKYAYRELLEGEDVVIGASKRKEVLETQSSALYRAEREMIDDWVTLLGGLPMMVGLTGKRVDEEPELMSWIPDESRAPGQRVMFAPSPASSPGESESEDATSSFGVAARASTSIPRGSRHGSDPISFNINVEEVQRKRDSLEQRRHGSSEVIECASTESNAIELENRGNKASSAHDGSEMD